jgi:hypothetical protein
MDFSNYRRWGISPRPENGRTAAKWSEPTPFLNARKDNSFGALIEQSKGV